MTERKTDATVSAATKEQVELVLALQAKANTKIFTTQAAMHATLLLKGVVCLDSRGYAIGASSTSPVKPVAARPPLLPWSPTLQVEAPYHVVVSLCIIVIVLDRLLVHTH
jgi:hypothetical protein